MKVRLIALLASLATSSMEPLSAWQIDDPAGGEVRNYLEVRRRLVELESARSNKEKAEELFKQGLISSAEREQARSRVKLAEIDYHLSLLSMLSVSPRVSVEKALKIEARNGRRFVKLWLKNQTPPFPEAPFRLLDSSPLPEELKQRELRDVFVSVRDSGQTSMLGEEGTRGTAIAYPYEARIDEFKPGETRELKFELLRDVNNIVVVISSQGTDQELDIQLQQAATNRAASLTSTRIFQEADLGEQAVYDLVVSRSGLALGNFRLGVMGLPQEIDYHFADPQTETRLSQISFPPGVPRRTLELRLFLPERSSQNVSIDRPISFWAMAADPDKFPGDLDRTRPWSAADAEAIGAGAIQLSITPRGLGRIEVDAPSLFSEIQKGESAGSRMLVRNVGSRTLDRTRIRVDAPVGWHASAEPTEIPILAVGESKEISLRFEPPADVQPGDYELRIRSESFAYNRPVPSEDKIYRLSIQSSSGSLATLALLGGMILLTVGVVLAGIRLARR